MINNNFINRHNGPTAADAEKMLKVIGVASQEQLISEIISPEIRLPQDLNIGRGMNEYECISHLKALGAKNKQYRTYIGLGYYNTITPGVIMRNILENPGWYTSYTPYQAEVSQGRLEALLNFQTVISDLTAMPLANASPPRRRYGSSRSHADVLARPQPRSGEGWREEILRCQRRVPTDHRSHQDSCSFHWH